MSGERQIGVSVRVSTQGDDIAAARLATLTASIEAFKRSLSGMSADVSAASVARGIKEIEAEMFKLGAIVPSVASAVEAANKSWGNFRTAAREAFSGVDAAVAKSAVTLKTSTAEAINEMLGIGRAATVSGAELAAAFGVATTAVTRLDAAESQLLLKYAELEGFNLRAIAAMRGRSFAVAPPDRPLGPEDEITRAGTGRVAYGTGDPQGLAIAPAPLSASARRAREAELEQTFTPAISAAAAEKNEQELQKLAARNTAVAGAAAVSWKTASAETIDSMLRIGDAGRVSAEEVAKAFGVSAKDVVAKTESAVSASTSIWSRLADHLGRPQMLRHVVAIPDEAMRHQIGAIFSSIGAMARDAGLSVGALTTSMGALVAVIAGGAIVKGVENLGAVASAARAGAVEAGMSTEQFSSLQGALEILGLKGETANRALIHFSSVLSEALGNSASKAAEHFNNLDITQVQLAATGGNASKALLLVADAIKNHANNANLAANVNGLFGRTEESLIEALKDGAMSFQEAQDAAKSYGLVLDEEVARKAEETGKKVRAAGLEMSGAMRQLEIAMGPIVAGILRGFADLAIGAEDAASRVSTALDRASRHPAVEAVGTAIGKALVAAEKATGDLPSAEDLVQVPPIVEDRMKMRPLAGALGQTTPGPTEADLAGPSATALPSAKPVITPESLEQQYRDAMQAASTAASFTKGISPAQLHLTENEAALTAAKKFQAENAEALNANKTLSDQVQQQILAKIEEVNNEKASIAASGARAAATAARQEYSVYAAAEKDKLTAAGTTASQVKAILEEWKAHAAQVFKDNATKFAQAVEQIKRAGTEAFHHIEEQAEQSLNKTLEKMRQLGHLMRQQMHIDLEVKTIQMRESGASPTAIDKTVIAEALAEAQKVGQQAKAEIAEVNAQLNATVAKLREAGATDQEIAQEQEKAQMKIRAITQDTTEEQIQLYNKAESAFKQMASGFTEFLSSLGSAFQSAQSSIFKALLDPQIELIHVGLTTERISQQGNEIRQAIGNMLIQAVNDAAKWVENTVSSVLGSMLAKALSVPAGDLGTVFSEWITKALGTAAPQLSQFTTLTTAGTTFAGSVTVSGTTFAAAITAAGTTFAATVTAAAGASAASSAAGGAAGLGGSLLSGAIKGLSSVPLISAIFERGGVVPSAQGGMIAGGIGNGIFSLLHPQEMVLPANISRGFQSMFAGGGSGFGDVNYNPTINTGRTEMSRGDFSAMLADHSGELMGNVRNAMAWGWRP